MDVLSKPPEPHMQSNTFLTALHRTPLLHPPLLCLTQIPEVMVQGHTDDVYGVAFHPKRPHKFATVCDSSNVFLWNSKRRRVEERPRGAGLRGWVQDMCWGECVHSSRSTSHVPSPPLLSSPCPLFFPSVPAIRQLTAKVSIGVAARAVAFSPNGAHLAVGTNVGSIKVRAAGRERGKRRQGGK